MQDNLFAPRWRGQAGRLEVWYTTITDPATGTGIWLHHELVAPTDGASPHTHGWLGVFAPGTTPVVSRFGPLPWRTAEVFAGGDVEAGPTRLRGMSAPDVSWDLDVAASGAPMFTFPRWAWHRELLPGAQIVPQPSARFTGTVKYQGQSLHLDDAPGASARIYGHGHARSWAWLHADLGGGDICEIVVASSHRPLLRALPPLVFMAMRVDGKDLLAGRFLPGLVRLRPTIDYPYWGVSGRLGRHRVEVDVTLPRDGTVVMDYQDPDGTGLKCANSERASATVRLLGQTRSRWLTRREWRLRQTAHAEVGGDALQSWLTDPGV